MTNIDSGQLSIVTEKKFYRTGPETPRLLHRAFEVEDAEAFFALNSTPDVMRFTGEPKCESVSEARIAIANYPDFDEVGFGRWACVLKETGDLIGFCGLKYLSDIDVVDIGYRFLPKYWGQGLATEACQASLQFGFQQLQLSRIYAFVLPQNLASVRVLQKTGFQPESQVQLLDEPDVLSFVACRNNATEE